MQHDRTARFPDLVVKNGTLVVDGYGLSLRVNRGRLCIDDGLAGQHRSLELSRPTCGLKRLIVLGSHGYVTLEALRWVTDVGAGFAQLDRDGHLLVTSAVFGRNDARLRRAQALSRGSETGLNVARELIAIKLQGQARVLSSMGADEVAREVLVCANALGDCASIEEIRRLESEAARTYWSSWKNVEMLFDKRSLQAIPEHWRRFGVRGSPLAMGGRLAINPANAILNYCYGLAEIECVLGLQGVGLDPGLGVLHADQKARESLALDLLEVVRPSVDEWVLRLLKTRPSRSGDFRETRQGVCRVLPPLTHTLSTTLSDWRRLAAPAAERLAGTFAADAGLASPPTTLTGTNRSRSSRAEPRVAPRRSATPPACKGCGESMPSRERRYCQACADEMDQVKVFAASGIAALARLRAEGRDPSASGAARAKVGMTNLARHRARLEWGATHETSVGPETFTSQILPKLGDISVPRLAAATGLSLIYCSRIRRGLVVPHPMHWEAFERAALG